MEPVALHPPFGIDRLVAFALVRDLSILVDEMTRNTAVAMLLLGTALAIGRTDRRAPAIFAQTLVIGAISIALFGLVGFSLGATSLNQVTSNSMAVNSATGLIALGLAIVTLTPRHGVMELLLGEGPSGRLARIALPVCFAVPFLLELLQQWLGVYAGISVDDGVAIIVVGNFGLTLALLWGCQVILSRSDAEIRAKAAALTLSEERYRQAGRIGNMGHWVYDAVNDRLHWTNELRSLLGVDADVVPSFAGLQERVHLDDRQQWQDQLDHAIAHGEDWSWQFRMVGVDGTIQHIKSDGVCRRGAGRNARIRSSACSSTTANSKPLAEWPNRRPSPKPRSSPT